MAVAPQKEGLLASSKELLSTMLGILRTRLELLHTEVEEEQIRVGGILWHGMLAALLLGFGLVFLALFLTVLLWDSNRLLVLGGAATVFLFGGVLALTRAMHGIQTGSSLFSASLAELDKDRQALDGDTGRDAAP